MAGLQKINSFVNKFVSLWSKGIEAKLFMETEAGKASVNLHATLGSCFLREHQDGQVCRVGDSQLRRREKRAATRQLAAEEVAQLRESKEKAVKAAEEALTADEANKVEVEETVIVIEEVDPSVSDDLDTFGEKATTSTNEMEVEDDSDCDIYIFRYWDNFNTSKTQEALDYIEKNIKQNFKKNKVKDSDQIYKVDKSENLEDNEIKVKVKLKKNNWSVERSARNVQTASQPGDPVSVLIKTILR